MHEDSRLLSSGWRRVGRNKRYIFWFFVLNAALAWFGMGAFENQAHNILDHSLHAQRLMSSFDVGAFVEMLARPEFGPTLASAAPAMHFALLFLFLTALFLPGVLQGYASNYRLPREEFFRACGRNLWRFIRLMLVAGIVMGVVGGALFRLRVPLLKASGESTLELLPFLASMASLLVIFLVMTVLRIWFDLAQTDVVLSDQRAVRKSIGTAFRHTWRSLGHLMASYVMTTIVAVIILLAGLFIWVKFVPATNIVAAAVASQITLLLLLLPRFWQRGVAVTYYLQNMVQPIPVSSFSSVSPGMPVAVPPVVATPVVVEPVAVNPVAGPVISNVPREPQAS